MGSQLITLSDVSGSLGPSSGRGVRCLPVAQANAQSHREGAGDGVHACSPHEVAPVEHVFRRSINLHRRADGAGEVGVQTELGAQRKRVEVVLVLDPRRDALPRPVRPGAISRLHRAGDAVHRSCGSRLPRWSPGALSASSTRESTSVYPRGAPSLRGTAPPRRAPAPGPSPSRGSDAGESSRPEGAGEGDVGDGVVQLVPERGRPRPDDAPGRGPSTPASAPTSVSAVSAGWPRWRRCRP